MELSIPYNFLADKDNQANYQTVLECKEPNASLVTTEWGLWAELHPPIIAKYNSNFLRLSPLPQTMFDAKITTATTALNSHILFCMEDSTLTNLIISHDPVSN